MQDTVGSHVVSSKIHSCFKFSMYLFIVKVGPCLQFYSKSNSAVTILLMVYHFFSKYLHLFSLFDV